MASRQLNRSDQDSRQSQAKSLLIKEFVSPALPARADQIYAITVRTPGLRPLGKLGPGQDSAGGPDRYQVEHACGQVRLHHFR